MIIRGSIFDWAVRPRTGRELYAALDARIARARNPYATLASSTTANRISEGVGVTLHWTRIVTVTPTGAITLAWGGWNTQTTNARMNSLLPVGYSVSGLAQHIIVTPHGYHPVPLYTDVEIGPRGAVRVNGRAVKPLDNWRKAEYTARKLTERRG
jgi:hypothetical protein